MATKVEFKDEIAFPAKVVLEKILDPEFVEKWTIVQQGLNPKVNLVSRTNDEAIIEIDLEEPLPVGTVKAHMKFRWDLNRMQCDWTRSAEGVAGKSKVYGTTILHDKGESMLFEDIINVDISIPLVGKKMEKTVLSYLKDGRQEKMDYLRRNLG